MRSAHMLLVEFRFHMGYGLLVAQAVLVNTYSSAILEYICSTALGDSGALHSVQ